MLPFLPNWSNLFESLGLEGYKCGHFEMHINLALYYTVKYKQELSYDMLNDSSKRLQ